MRDAFALRRPAHAHVLPCKDELCADTCALTATLHGGREGYGFVSKAKLYGTKSASPGF